MADLVLTALDSVQSSLRPPRSNRARAAFERVWPQASAIPGHAVIRAVGDVRGATRRAGWVGCRDQQPDRLARFAAFVRAGALDRQSLDDLPRWALATEYGYACRQAAGTFTSASLLRSDPAREALAVGRRLRRGLRWHLDPHRYRAVGEHCAVRGGVVDLRRQLLDLAQLGELPCVAERLGVAQHADIRRARSLAAELRNVAPLASEAENVWAERVDRLWTMLDTSYRNVRRVGRLAFFALEDTDVSYPPLEGRRSTTMSHASEPRGSMC